MEKQSKSLVIGSLAEQSVRFGYKFDLSYDSSYIVISISHELQTTLFSTMAASKFLECLKDYDSCSSCFTYECNAVVLRILIW